MHTQNDHAGALVLAYDLSSGIEAIEQRLAVSFGYRIARAGMTTFSPSSRTILLLISDPLMREVIHDVLDTAGYQVLMAGELGAAVDRIREVRPDLLITRPFINSMPGQTAADYLRTKRPGLPILIVSGFMEDDRVRDRNAIKDLHIFPKPFGRDELLSTIKEILAARAS